MTRKLTYVMLALMSCKLSFAQVATGTYETQPDSQPDFNGSRLIGQSFMGSVGGTPPIANAPSSFVGYWNVINIRHRNGGGDGNLYGAQLTIGMTSLTDRMFFRVHNVGTWTPWYEAYSAATPRVRINNAVDDGSSALQVNGTAKASIVVAAKDGSGNVSSQFYLRNISSDRALISS